MKLSNKQRVFIAEYLKCWNATEAARRAGYSGKYLDTNASKLLDNTRIRNAIQKRLTEVVMSSDEALARLSEQARAEYSAFFTANGLVDVGALLDAGKGHLIKKVRPTKEGIEIEFYDAQSALRDIAKYHGLLTDRVDVTSGDQPLDEVLDGLFKKVYGNNSG